MTDWREREFKAAEEIAATHQMNAKDEGQHEHRFDDFEHLRQVRWCEDRECDRVELKDMFGKWHPYLIGDTLNALQQQVTELAGKAARYEEALTLIAEPRYRWGETSDSSICLSCGVETYFEKDGEIQHEPDCSFVRARDALTSPSPIAQEEQR